MCDRKNLKPDEAMMDRLIERAIEDLKNEWNNTGVKPRMIIHDEPELLGKTLVRVNQLGLRVLKGGKKPTSEDVAKAILKRNYYNA